MKVGIIHTTYRHMGGEDIVVRQESSMLCENGHDTSILSFTNPSSAVTAFIVFLLSVFNVRSFFKTLKWISRECPDIIHIHNWHYAASPSVFVAARMKGIPVIHTLHNFRMICPSGTLFFKNELFLKSLDQPFPWSAVLKGVYRNSRLQTFWLSFVIWIHRACGTWSGVDKFIVLSNHARETFTTVGKQFNNYSCVVKPNFVDAIQLTGVPRNQNFLFVGRLSPEKGIDVMLRAFSDSPHRLTIIGDGPLRTSVEEAANNFSNISYLGFCDRDKILAEMQSCSALICPSIWFEGNPITVIEAFACAAPVIATDIGVLKSMITHDYNGLHFNRADSDDLRKILDRWMGFSKEHKAILSDNAYRSFQINYTRQKNFTQLIRIYLNEVQCRKLITPFRKTAEI